MKLLHRLTGDAPLFMDGTLEVMLLEAAEWWKHDLQAAEHPFFKKLKEPMRPQMEMIGDDIARIPIAGTLAWRPDFFEMVMGAEDSEALLGLVDDAARNRDVKGILLAVDSPGGFYTGGLELADAVHYANKRKPVAAWTGGAMASLAYMVGSQARTVMASRSAQVGSIGVFGTHIDRSKMLEALGIKVEVFRNKEAEFKAAGLLGTALTEAQRTHLQERAQAAFGEFKGMVHRARPQVGDETMRGQVLNGIEAKKAGLVDRVGNQGFALGVLRQEMRRQG